MLHHCSEGSECLATFVEHALQHGSECFTTFVEHASQHGSECLETFVEHALQHGSECFTTFVEHANFFQQATKERQRRHGVSKKEKRDGEGLVWSKLCVDEYV